MITLDWSQVFGFRYQITGWHVVVMDVGFIHMVTGDTEPDMQWNLFVRHDASMDEFMYAVRAGLKALSNKTLPSDFNSMVFSLLDNRPALAGK